MNSETKVTKKFVLDEWQKCHRSFIYFVTHYCYIYDSIERAWIPFKLWDFQKKCAKALRSELKIIILKARQLGYTWLVLCYALWTMIFRPVAVVLIFSVDVDSAVYLLSKHRLRGIYYHLPQWMKDVVSPVRVTNTKKEEDNRKAWSLSNGSVARAFAVGKGDSQTATLAIVDEADLPDEESQEDLEESVKPTVEGGGQYIKLSKSDKKKPNSPFKTLFLSAYTKKITDWHAIFSPWFDHPERDKEWYEQQVREAKASHKADSIDTVKANYPNTVEEALSPREAGKRFKSDHLDLVKEIREPLKIANPPDVPGLRIYVRPKPGRVYAMGVDTAEGNPDSDDSAIVIVDAITWRQVAVMNERVEPGVFVGYIATAANYYNDCGVLIERNNHGHAVILGLRNDTYVDVLEGFDNRPGWATSEKSKTLAMNFTAKAIKDQECKIHDLLTYHQLQSIEGGTLRAPKGQHDDLAIAFVLAITAAQQSLSKPLF